MCLLGKFKLLIATAYIRTNSIDCTKSHLQELEAAQHFNKTNQLDGLNFLGDLKARNDYCDDSTNNLHRIDFHNHLQIEFSIIKYGDHTLWIENADRASWTKTLEVLSENKMEIDHFIEIWSRIKQSIGEASGKIIPTKKSCHQSKPF